MDRARPLTACRPWPVSGASRAEAGPAGLSRRGFPTLLVPRGRRVAAFVVPPARLLAVNPLNESTAGRSGARGLGRSTTSAIRSRPLHRPAYPALQYPLLLPGLEALDFRFMGGFDGTLVHLQLLGFGIAFVGGAWVLLRDPRSAAAARRQPARNRHRTIVLQPVCRRTSRTSRSRSSSRSASRHSPRGSRSGEVGLLRAAALFLAAGALAENEGELFALAAYVAAAVVAPRGILHRSARRREALATLAVDLPSRVLGRRPPSPGRGTMHCPTSSARRTSTTAGTRVAPDRARAVVPTHRRLEAWSFVVPAPFSPSLAGALAAFRATSGWARSAPSQAATRLRRSARDLTGSLGTRSRATSTTRPTGRSTRS